MHIVENEPKPVTPVVPTEQQAEHHPTHHRATTRVPVRPIVPRGRRAPTRQEIQDAEDGADSRHS